jgi:hypothetical protein
MVSDGGADGGSVVEIESGKFGIVVPEGGEFAYEIGVPVAGGTIPEGGKI